MGIFRKRRNCTGTLTRAPGGPQLSSLIMFPHLVSLGSGEGRSGPVPQPCCPQGLPPPSSTHSSWVSLTLYLIKHVLGVPDKTQSFKPLPVDMMNFRHQTELPIWHHLLSSCPKSNLPMAT
uniref:Uncharacterized protein n=1 Tax=Myotis myotis TaxID=51298 RepID=A0A7J7Y0L2_MYOMY|nr:hypothetical protein mMyoMyo1_011320 [Myotis myotis]